MTKATGSGGRRLASSLRHPLALLRRARARGMGTVLLLVLALPGGVRRPVGRTIGPRLARRARHSRSRLLPPVAFVATYAAGSRGDARAIAVAAAVPATSPAARRSLAELALTGGMPDAADRLLGTMPDDRSPGVEAMRARLAYDAGRYGEARELALAAAGGGVAGMAGLAALADGQLVTLRAGWLPDLGPAAAPLARARGAAVPGRVAHLVSISLPHRLVGYTVRTQSVVRCQAAAGLDPHVVTRAGFPGTSGVHGAPAVEVVDGIRHHRVEPEYPYAGPPDATLTHSARATAELLATLKPAVLQPASNHLQAQTALALAGPLGIPVVYEVRGFWEESWVARASNEGADAMTADRYRMTREVETACMLASDAVVTLSETMRTEIIERGCAPDRVIIVPNAVEEEKFNPVPRDDGLGASLGIEPGDVVAGYISSLNAYEGIAYLLEAAARLRPQHPRLRVLLVGDGDEGPAIREAANRLGLDDGTLVMPGRVPHEQILRYYSLIDVFVVPRTADRVSQLVTPLKPFEAMALERATVVSDLPALREIVTSDETGRRFRPEDADDLARVLGELIDDPALRARLGRQAREWVLAERTWTANGRRYRELFERLGVA